MNKLIKLQQISTHFRFFQTSKDWNRLAQAESAVSSNGEKKKKETSINIAHASSKSIANHKIIS